MGNIGARDALSLLRVAELNYKNHNLSRLGTVRKGVDTPLLVRGGQYHSLSKA